MIRAAFQSRRLAAGILVLAALPAVAGAGLLERLTGRQPAILPVEQAFPFHAARIAPGRVALTWDVHEGYYLYRDKLDVTLAPAAENAITRVQTPAGKVKDDPYFGQLQVFTEPVSTVVSLERPAGSGLTLIVRYQGCAEAGLCYPPQRIEYRLGEGIVASGIDTGPVAAPGSGVPSPLQTPPAADDFDDEDAPDAGLLTTGTARLTALLDAGQPLPILAAFFGAGLLLAFTACLYPMIPILSGLIAGDRERRRGWRAFALSLAYVEAMALTYAAAGALAGLTGSAIQADLQGPWVLGAFATLFVLLALGMFGAFELQLPSAWQSRVAAISGRRRGGSFAGVAAMGALSALIVGACSGPALIAGLAFIGATGKVWLGGLALFVLANGMGLPLLVVGTAAGKWLPTAGPWMIGVRRVFGVGFLVVALWLLGRVLPATAALALWGALLVGCGIWLGGLDRLTSRAGARPRLRKTAGLVLVVWGVTALVGAAAGGRDVWQPLRGLGLAGSGAHGAPTVSIFRPVRDAADLRAALARAEQANQPVLLDVYADWCVYCVQLDEKVFAEPRVRQALAGAVLLRADVTEMDADDRALLDALQVYLPPAVIFYGADGRERGALRVVGFLGPERFIQRASAALYGTGSVGL